MGDVPRCVPGAGSGPRLGRADLRGKISICFDKVPMVLKPVQLPHPPLWSCVSRPDHARLACGQTTSTSCRWRRRPLLRPIFERYSPPPQARQADTTLGAGVGAMSWSPTLMRSAGESRGAPIRAGAPILWCFDATASAPRVAISIRNLRQLATLRTGGRRLTAHRASISSPPRSGRPHELFRPWPRLRRHDGAEALHSSICSPSSCCPRSGNGVPESGTGRTWRRRVPRRGACGTPTLSWRSRS